MTVACHVAMTAPSAFRSRRMTSDRDPRARNVSGHPRRFVLLARRAMTSVTSTADLTSAPSTRRRPLKHGLNLPVGERRRPCRKASTSPFPGEASEWPAESCAPLPSGGYVTTDPWTELANAVVGSESWPFTAMNQTPTESREVSSTRFSMSNDTMRIDASAVSLAES